MIVGFYRASIGGLPITEPGFGRKHQMMLAAADLFHDSCEHGPVLSSRCRALGVQVHGNANKTAEPPVRVRTWRRDRIACVDPAPIRTVTVGPGITPGRPHTMLLCEVRGLSPPIGNFTQPRRGFFSCWPQR